MAVAPVAIAGAALAATPDLDAIDSYVKNMVEKGASKDEVKTYLDHHGVTPDQLLDRGGIVDTIAKPFRAVADAVRGQQDPAFADVPGFTGEGITDADTLGRINRGKAVTFTDEAYGDVIRKTLGDRLVKSEKDRFDQEVITYRGDDGTERRAYINKPGLEGQDVDRLVSSAAPFMIGGGIAAGIGRGMGTLANIGLQILGGGATSMAADVAAQRMGSEEPIDFGRAGWAAGGAGFAQALSPMVAAMYRKFWAKPGIVKDGQLTPRGRAEAERIGLDPDDLTDRMVNEVGEKLTKSADETEAQIALRTGEFGIPTTKGTRTGDSQMVQMEVEMRRGLWGEDAKRIITEFDKSLGRSVETAAYEQIGGRISRQGGREKATLGSRIQDGVRTAKRIWDQQENLLWGAVGPMYPKREAYDLLAPIVRNEFSARGFVPTEEAAPRAFEMLRTMQGFVEGEDFFPKTPLLGDSWRMQGLDDMRRQLLGIYQAAETPTDKMASRAAYNGFNKWIDDIADKAMIRGDVAAAARLKAARGFTKEMHELFSPTDRLGRLTAAGKILENIIEKADSPERVIDSLFSGPSSAPRAGAADALDRLKTILTGPNGDRAVWDDIRMAAWVRLVQNKEGDVLSPRQIQKNIDTAFSQQSSLMNSLFSAEERALMKRFSKALDDATWVDPNPSGTSYALENMRRRFSGSDSAMKMVLQTQQKRQTFSKHNFMMARVYQLLARKAPFDVFNIKGQAQSSAARGAVSQDVTPRRPVPLGPLGGAAGAVLEDDLSGE